MHFLFSFFLCLQFPLLITCFICSLVLSCHQDNMLGIISTFFSINTFFPIKKHTQLTQLTQLTNLSTITQLFFFFFKGGGGCQWSVSEWVVKCDSLPHFLLENALFFLCYTLKIILLGTNVCPFFMSLCLNLNSGNLCVLSLKHQCNTWLRRETGFRLRVLHHPHISQKLSFYDKHDLGTCS